MTQMTVAPQSMPVIAAAQATAAPGTDPGAADDFVESAESGVDFAAVLQAQIAQPAKDALESEIIAALLPAQESIVAEEAAPTGGQPDASGLAALLAVLLPPAAKIAPGEGRQSAEPAMTEAAGGNAVSLASHSALPGRTAADAGSGEDKSLVSVQSARQAIANSSLPAQAETVPDQRVPIAVAAQTLQAGAGHADPTVSVPGAAPLAQTAPSSGTPSPSVMRIDTPVGGRGWDTEVGQKVVLMASRQESRAELTLTPPQLGKVEITISINGDQSSATFVSASPAAREALEQALPRLREMLAEAGITLGQASVNAESAQRDRDESPADGRGGRLRADAAHDAESSTQWVRRSSGLVDTFA